MKQLIYTVIVCYFAMIAGAYIGKENMNKSVDAITNSVKASYAFFAGDE